MLIVWLICTLGLVTNSITSPINSTQSARKATTFTAELDQSDENADLEKAESNDKKKLEIIKQIHRVNSDGSYTVGYEAVDGRFKIESRDVLGNVKGTYGYVDSNGEIKRVSYTANNATNDVKSTPQPLAELTEVPRLNKTSFASQATRRPSSLSFLMTSTSSPAQMNANIMQAIPKRRILLTSALAANHGPPQYSFRKADSLNIASGKSASQPTEAIPTVVYATSIRSTIKPAVENEAVEQLLKLNKFESNTKDKGLKLDENEKENLQTERKPTRGNSLRRQLSGDQSENFESHQQIVYSQASDEESTHTYTGVTDTQRPVFTTTSSPRIPALVLAARSRAARIKNAALLSTQTPSSTTERTYAKQPRRNSETRENKDSKNDPITDREYLTQSPEIVQIPSSRDNQQKSEIKSHSHRHPNAYLPKSRDFPRQSPAAAIQENNEGPIQYKFPTQTQPAYTQQNQDDNQFLRETTDSNLNIATTISPEPFTNNDLKAATQSLLQSFHPNNQRAYDSRHSARSQHESQPQQSSIPLPLQPYHFGYGPLNAPQYNYPDRPATARDFERLLSLLVLRNQQQQRFSLLPGLMNGFHHGGLNGLGNFGDYNAYNPFNYQAMRSPLYNQFDPRYTAFSRSLPPLPPPNSFYGTFSEQENMYQAQNPVEQHLSYMRHSIQPRKKFNDNYSIVGIPTEYGESAQKELKTESFLPPEVREELLYRMLILAIQPDMGGQLSVPDASTMQEYFRAHTTVPAKTIPTASISNSKKPVRSVQILGEE